MTSIRAVGLLSGGLDSALAARLLLDQGIEVVALHLESPTACRSDVRAVAAELGVRLVTRPKGEEYLRLLRHPRFGYGKNMNPCIDCRMFMFRLGADYLAEFDAAFLFTGEVLGQRPMSQMRKSIELIDRESGLAGRILRPLSAKLLPETEAELRGWVDRERLLGIHGRGRTFQLQLAQQYGLSQHQSPGGGCLLTDVHYSEKLRDLFDHTPEEHTSASDLALLRIGRHVRLADDLKVVLGRDRDENLKLAGFESDQRVLVEPVGFKGPSALVCGRWDDHVSGVVAGLIAQYSAALVGPAEVRWRLGEEWRTAPVPAPQPAPSHG